MRKAQISVQIANFVTAFLVIVLLIFGYVIAKGSNTQATVVFSSSQVLDTSALSIALKLSDHYRYDEIIKGLELKNLDESSYLLKDFLGGGPETPRIPYVLWWEEPDRASCYNVQHGLVCNACLKRRSALNQCKLGDFKAHVAVYLRTIDGYQPLVLAKSLD